LSGTLTLDHTVKIFYLAFLLLAGLSLPGAETKPISKLELAELEACLKANTRAVLLQRDGLQAVVRYLESLPELFPTNSLKESRLLRREEKEIVWNTWQRFLDQLLALDALEQYHAGFLRLKGPAKEDSFLISDAAMLAKYRAALEFIDRTEHNPELDKVLNEPVPELGLPAGTYAKLKFKYLNLAIATDFAAHEVMLKTFSDDRQPALREAIQADAAYILKAGRGQGELLTAKNALKVIQNGAQSAWLPIQSGVSEWMGDTKVYRPGRSLISPEQIKELQPKLLPGDVLLERHEWYLSNIGLPGFWSHAAIYLGAPAERRAYFADADVQVWVKAQGQPDGDLEALLQTRSSAAYELSRVPQEEDHAVRVMEAISEGVSFTTAEHLAESDSLAVLRPRLSKVEKAQALMRAFHYAGRPYDFNFDFSTDAELVCTELVYKSYEPATGMTGLNFPLIEMLGRKVTPANELVKQFDVQYGTAAQQYDLVAFLDGIEKQSKAVEASLVVFRESWKRPKWHVLVQKVEP
jgi:hypothetical protein